MVPGTPAHVKCCSYHACTTSYCQWWR